MSCKMTRRSKRIKKNQASRRARQRCPVFQPVYSARPD